MHVHHVAGGAIIQKVGDVFRIETFGPLLSQDLERISQRQGVLVFLLLLTFPDQDLAQKFLDGEVTEIIAAHPLDRDRSEPVIPGEARGTLLAIRSGAVPGSLAKFTGMRRAASLLSAVLFYSSTRSQSART